MFINVYSNGLNMQPKKQLDRNTLIYLVNEITKNHGIKNTPPVKLGRLMYLLWLEYASLQPGLTFPPNSPMADMRFINYERGPAEELSSDNFETVRNEIISGHIPTFDQTAFKLTEKHNLEQAFNTVRDVYSMHRATDLCNFIMYDLPTCQFKPKICELTFSDQEFVRELRTFMRKRDRLK